MNFRDDWWIVKDNRLGTMDNIHWCREMFGISNLTGRWFWKDRHFYFRNQKDAIIYILRWS